MYGDLDSMEDYWKKLEHLHAAADVKGYAGPCFLSAAHLTAGTGGAATAIIRDGHNTDAEAKVYMSALTSANDLRQFNPPLYFKRGLDLDVGSNVTSLLVHFLPERERKG